MRKKSKKDRIAAIAKATGGKVGEPIDGVVNGPVGATRLAAILSARLRPSQGKGTGRPTDPAWSISRRIPMKQTTFEQLEELAESFSHQGRKISPMQVAAELLERGLELVKKDEEEVGV
jgi:hypothetical protein